MREDWTECSLGDLLTLKNGYAFKSSKYVKSGIPVIRIGDINDWTVDVVNAKQIDENDEYDRFVINYGDILIAMSGATTGKFGIFKSEKKAYQNQRVGNLKLNSANCIDKSFAYNLLHSLKLEIEKEAYGGAQPNISASKIEKLKTILAPLPEQRAIVAKIEELFSELDKGEEDLKKSQEQLKIYRQAVLKKAFEGDWDKVKLEELYEFIGGGTPNKDEAQFWNGNIPWASVKDVKNTFLTETKDSITKSGLENSSSKVADTGDVIIITRISPGNSAICKIKVAINQDLKIVKPKTQILNTYTHYLFNSLKGQILRLSSGTTVKGITLNNLKTIEVPKIAYEEQIRISAEIESRLSVCDSIEASIRESLDRSKSLRQSILKKAFEGTLLSEEEIAACKATSDYEPASVLLERIKAEKKKN